MGESNDVSFLGTQAAATLALNLLCLHAASPAHVPMYHKSGNCVTPVALGLGVRICDGLGHHRLRHKSRNSSRP